MVGRQRRALAVFLAGLWAPVAVHAGGGIQSGSIEGVVRLVDGTPAAGAMVTLEAGHLPDGPRHEVADGRGFYRFADLPPGDYDVIADLPGVGSGQAYVVRVAIAGRVQLHLTLFAATDEVITIEGRAPVIDAGRTAVSHQMDRSFFDKLPVDRRSFPSLLQAFPGTLQTHNQDIILRGGSWVDNQLLIDGVNYSDPISNSILTRFDFYSLAQVEILSGAYEAEYGQAMGGVINMVTRSGGDRHEVGGRVSLSPRFFATGSANHPAGDQYDLNANVGGPLVRGKASYFGSATYQREYTPFDRSSGLALAPGRSRDALLGFAKITAAPVPSGQLTLHLSGFWEHLDNAQIEELVLAEAQERVETGGLTGQVAYRHGRGDTSYELSAGGYLWVNGNEPVSGDREQPSQFDLMTGAISQNTRTLVLYRNLRGQLQGSIGRYLEAWGRHELKVGAELALMSILFETAQSGNEVVFTSGQPCIPEEGVFDGCVLAERSGTQGADGRLIPGGFQSSASGSQLGLYVRDSWDVGRGVRINAGWRTDLGIIDDQEGARLADFRGWWGPRLGASWNIGQSGSTVVRAHAGRYYQTGVLALPLFFGPSLRREVYSFNERTGQFDIHEQQRSSGGDTGARSDPSLASTAPHSDEFTAAVEQALGKGISISLTGIHRRLSYIYSSVETNLIWNESGDSVIGFRDGTPHASYSMRTSADYFREYAGLELAVRGHLGRQGMFMAGYTLSRLYGTSDLNEVTRADTVVPYVVSNPRQYQYLYGPLSTDRRHIVKLAGSYTIEPARVTVGSVFSLASGAPYSRLYYNAFLNGYHDRRAPRGIDPGDLNDPSDDRPLRGAAWIDWNLFASWDISRWIGVSRVTVDLQIFNLLDRRSPLQIEERDVDGGGGGGGFGSSVLRQRPLRVVSALSFRY
jgi:hypothetical protein